MKNIGTSISLPGEAPVMPLPKALLLPNTLLPLYIFEERYREMLEHCLRHDRMFCVALMKPGVTDADGPEDFFHVAGLGLVRACVAAPDGTSNLVLQGLARVEFTDFTQETPFRVARLRVLKSTQENVVEAEALAAKVLELCGQLKESGLELPPALARQVPHLSDPEALADIVAGACLPDPFQRQRILEQLEVSARLRQLIRDLTPLLP